MLLHRLLQFLLLLTVISSISSGPWQRWTFDLLELTSNSSDRNLVDLDFHVIRLGRGKFGFSGFINFKIDLYDDAALRVTIERSKYRHGPYFMFPMAIENATLSKAMNIYYKTLLQPDAEKCCKNAPIVTTKFELPLTKRNIEINKCALSTDNLPNIILEGYYRMRATLYGPFEMNVEAISYVENKIF